MMTDQSKLTALQEENSALKAELAALKESKTNYQRMFELSADALSILDLDSGCFIECNQAAIDMHGVESEANFLNLSPADLSPEHQPCGGLSADLAKQRIEKAFTEGPQVFRWEHSRLDGSTFPCLVSLTALPSKTQNCILAIGR
ncbi:MAG: PAS domain-containing protein, partial [Kangiellaceae bacterium]|nr:PAS domain-containing protein [Kangiellaceae bacterium]